MPLSEGESKRSRPNGVRDHQASRGPDPLTIARYVFFFLTEIAFVALAWSCYVHPILLPWYNRNIGEEDIRSGLVAIFSFWHTTAVECVLYLSADLLRGTRSAHNIESELRGLISKITQSVSYIIHSPKTVKIALLVHLALILFRIVGTSTITVDNGGEFEQSLPIGSIVTFALNLDSTDVVGEAVIETLFEADMAVRLEQLYGRAWGYISPPNFLIPLPTQELNASKVIYDSDVVSFHYTCQWRAPDRYSDGTVMIGNTTWTAGISSNGTATHIVEYGPSIIFLLPEDRNQDLTGDSVYLFLGSNATISPALNLTSVSSSIDLSNLPTIFNPNFFAGYFTPFGFRKAPLATLLICSPNLEFLSRRVRLYPTANRSEPDTTIASNSDIPSPSNIHQQATRNLFSIILNRTIMSPDPFDTPHDGVVNYNFVSATMLLSGTAYNEDSTSYSPLDLKTINQNVESYTLSAFKAFIGGYRGQVPRLRSQQEVFARNVSGMFTSRKLALQTSLPFAVVHTVLFIVLGTVLAGLVYSDRLSRLIGFT